MLTGPSQIVAHFVTTLPLSQQISIHERLIHTNSGEDRISFSCKPPSFLPRTMRLLNFSSWLIFGLFIYEEMDLAMYRTVCCLINMHKPVSARHFRFIPRIWIFVCLWMFHEQALHHSFSFSTQSPATPRQWIQGWSSWSDDDEERDRDRAFESPMCTSFKISANASTSWILCIEWEKRSSMRTDFARYSIEIFVFCMDSSRE